MMQEIKQVAERIRDLREIEEMPVEELAKKLDMSLDEYLRFESGDADIPVSVLYKIANLFNVELSALLTGENPRLHIYSIVRKGKGISVDRRKEYAHESLAFNFANKVAEPFLVTVNPEAKDGQNSHPGQEFNYVLSGELQISIGNHIITLSEGDSLYFDATYQHGMKALNNTPAQFIAVIF